MKPFLLPLLLLIAITGCANKDEATTMAPAALMERSAGKDRALLAYEHSISVDTEEGNIPAIFEATQAACRDAVEDHCTVMESRTSAGQYPSALLRLRASPAGVRKIVAALGKQADITDQSTTAEDLAAPITDAAKQLAMLKDYRSKLEALSEKARNDVDALIKVNRELAQVQSELESAEGAHAHLMQRVDTEILTVSIRSAQHYAFWKPVGIAFSDFGKNLSQGISFAVAAIAFLLPAVIVLLVGFFAGRRLWRRKKESGSV